VRSGAKGKIGEILKNRFFETHRQYSRLTHSIVCRGERIERRGYSE
jgi:hypothetical protein